MTYGGSCGDNGDSVGVRANMCVCVYSCKIVWMLFFPAVLGYMVTTYAYVFIWDLPEEFLWVVLRLTGR